MERDDFDMNVMLPCLQPSFNHGLMLYPIRVRKLFLWVLSLLLVFVVVGLLGGAIMNHWLSGEEFHTLMEQKSSQLLHAKTSFGPLHWGWFELSSPSFHAEGQGSTSLRELEIGGLQGQLKPSALLHGLLQIEEITLENARLHIDTARHPKDPSLTVHQQLTQQPSMSLPSWVPSLLVIDLINAKKTDILIDLPSGTSLDLRGTHLEAYPEGSETRFEARGGTVKSPLLPELDINTIRCRIKPDMVDLSGADLVFPKGGALQLEGIFPDTNQSSLSGLWQQVPVATLLPTLSNQVSGTLDGSATVSWDLAGANSIEGKVQANNVILSNIPLLEGVSELTRMEAFKYLYLQQARATFSIKGERSSWHDVVLESQQLLKLTGDAEVGRDGAFSGNFQLGLSSPIVTAIPGASQVFSKDQHDGYYWTSLQVGGSLSHLTEDLTPRIMTAVLSNAGLLLQQGVKQGLQILGIKGAVIPAPLQPETNGTTKTVPSSSPQSSTPVDDLKQGAGAALDVIGGFLK